MLRAARLDRAVYAELRVDETATYQAVVVVGLAALATGVIELGSNGIGGLLSRAAQSLIGFVVAVALIYVIGSRILTEPETRPIWKELVRTLGFAQASLLLQVFSFLPGGVLILPATRVWQFIAMAIAAQEAPDHKSAWTSAAVILAGFLAHLYIAGG